MPPNTSKESAASSPARAVLQAVALWFDAEAQSESRHPDAPNRINWLRCLPFIGLHLACFAVLFTGWSSVALLVCLAAFWLRMFAITAFYHRYFSHRSYKTGRGWQFVFAVLGNAAAQRGPLWWAAHHRNHHKHSDREDDLHSPLTHGFWWSHVGWFMSHDGFRTDYSVIKDLAKYPELRFLNRFDSLVPACFAMMMYGLGVWIGSVWPETGVTGLQMLVWGFVISTVLLFHATFTINSLGHVWGSRRFKTKDDSRNNFWLALLTLGEGWHNNHHRFAVSARQGFYWWEIDISYALLKVMSWCGIVSNLNPVPARIREEGRLADQRKGVPDQNIGGR